jgi:hypothetical protein
MKTGNTRLRCYQKQVSKYASLSLMDLALISHMINILIRIRLGPPRQSGRSPVSLITVRTTYTKPLATVKSCHESKTPLVIDKLRPET